MQKAKMVDGQHQIVSTKKRRADEEKDLALVGLKRMVERNKAEKMH